MASNSFDFSIDVVGDSTGDKFPGDFSAKQRLSHRDQLQKDILKRGLLGENAQFAAGDAVARAEMFAHLSTSLTKTPIFWREAGNGLDLFDDNVVLAVYEAVIKEQARVVEDLKKKGEDAKEALRAKKKE